MHGASHERVVERRADVAERHRRLVELAATEEKGGAMRLDLSEDDAQAVAPDHDLAGASVHDVERTRRGGELPLVACQRPFRQRPRHVLERDAQRVRRASDGKPGDVLLLLTAAARECER
jgi:hypothetical protein